MDPIKNPFSPGAGSPPPELVGREGILEQARILGAQLARHGLTQDYSTPTFNSENDLNYGLARPSRTVNTGGEISCSDPASAALSPSTVCCP